MCDGESRGPEPWELWEAAWLRTNFTDEEPGVSDRARAKARFGLDNPACPHLDELEALRLIQ